MTVVFIFPLYWIATLSFQDGITASTLPPKFVFAPTIQNYRNLFEGSGFGQVMWNTTVIAIGTTFVALLFGTPAAYALARFPVGSSEQISFTVLSVRIIPSYVAVVPLFIILQQLNLFGTAIGVIVAGSLVGISFVIWMMRAFFAGIPARDRAGSDDRWLLANRFDCADRAAAGRPWARGNGRLHRHWRLE